MKLFIALVITVSSHVVFAWGGRGHAAVCESAVYLVQNKNLKEFLGNKPHVMGHLCNIPDIYWKSLTPEIRKHGDAGHFIDPEILGLTVKQMPLDYKAIIEKYTGQENLERRNTRILSVPIELGSNWWRADQFYRLAVEKAKLVQSLPVPSNSKEEQDENLPFNKAFYDMFVYMGLMGHFVGDNGQPFHVTSDYDGYAANHGGIHAYFEDSAVGYFGPDLQERIVKKAGSLKNASFMKAKTVVERMKALAELSSADIKEVLKVDPMISPSTFKLEKGMSIKSAAKRQPAEVGQKKFEKLIVEEMARSALLLATLWDEAFDQAGNPEVKAYKSYRYPHTPEFVMPDYYDTKAEDAKKK